MMIRRERQNGDGHRETQEEVGSVCRPEKQEGAAGILWEQGMEIKIIRWNWRRY